MCKAEPPERGNKKSRFKNPASTVARRATVVEIHLAVALADFRADRVFDWDARGVAWSSMEPSPGLGEKKQTASDCDLRNFRRFDEGAGAYRTDRIAAGELLRSVAACWALSFEAWSRLRYFLKLGLRKRIRHFEADHLTTRHLEIFGSY
jgi:hypothetical protein